MLKSISRLFSSTIDPIFCTLMETPSIVQRDIGDPSLLVSSLHLLVPPLQLLSAAMWQVLQQQDVLHYGKLEEFVSLVMEAFPELLSESQRTELTLGLQVRVRGGGGGEDEDRRGGDMSPAEIGCKTHPALEVLLWEFLSRLDQLLPVPDLKQTVSWLSAAPSVLEVCVQSVSHPGQLKTLLRHHRSLGQLDMNATQCKLSSMSRPPSQRAVDSPKLTNTNSEEINADSVMDSSDYTGVEPRSSLNRCEDIEEGTEKKTGYLMSREQKDILIKMKEEEEEDGERQSVKMEGEDGVRDEEGLWKEEEKEREGHVTDQFAKTNKWAVIGVKPEHGQEEEPSSLVTSCLLKQPKVLIRRIGFANSSVPVSSSLSPLKLRPSSSEDGTCAEDSLIFPVISPRNQNAGSDHTGQTVEVSSQVFGCSQCPFVHTEVVNHHQHLEKVHPEELNRTLGSQQPPSSTYQRPNPTQSPTGTPGARTCSQSCHRLGVRNGHNGSGLEKGLDYRHPRPCDSPAAAVALGRQDDGDNAFEAPFSTT
ncbi:hypothetical protein SKAU_G00355350 [Synaphobranchus kaupii]|uniref:TERF1-interacting nuclear factor 2 N-terminal domain-containing protein n=1 Tax=Synaphobranchus kaupii TaxID=118154 RepID=A0A9Q1EH66_SYNKA|nr:hypothetical protein SKAU_G00355350 [Synaphobranchus kaupii]